MLNYPEKEIRESSRKISFTVHPALELACAMYILGNGADSLSLSADIGFQPDKLLLDMGRRGAECLSKHIQKELRFFMERIGGCFVGLHPLNSLPFRAVLDNPTVKDAAELIGIFERCEDDYIPYLIAQSALGLRSRDEYSAQLLTDYAASLSPEEEDLRDKLLECIGNPLEARQRFCLLLRQFYENAYKPFEADILGAINAESARYAQLFDEAPSAFANDYLRLDLMRCEAVPDVALSLFLQIGSLLLRRYGGADIIILGIRSDRRFGSEVVRKSVLSFHKLLSDEKRFRLLELLSDSPKYGNELAELLDLAPSTVCHHLSYFARMGLVLATRNEHRLYYTLDKEKVRALFDRSANYFMKE